MELQFSSFSFPVASATLRFSKALLKNSCSTALHCASALELTRAVKEDNGQTHAYLSKFSVKEWQNVRHNDLSRGGTGRSAQESPGGTWQAARECVCFRGIKQQAVTSRVRWCRLPAYMAD
eukprot:1159629-Pelagomonas_calceolata.AAC.3